MSFNNINTKLRSERGFTIVELLIVIVVIGILAAITIVSFNGVTAKANTSSAQSASVSTIKKAEAYNAEKTTYPVLTTDLLSAASTETYNLTGVSFTATALTDGTKPSSPSQIQFFKCANAAGLQVKYYNYSTNAWVTQVTGTCTTPTFVAG